MNQPSCEVCLDLSYDLFEPGHQFSPSASQDGLAKYRAIEFRDLQRAAAAGCPSCTVLDQGIGLFWGDRLEEREKWLEHTLLEDETAIIILESRPGRSLFAFKSFRLDAGAGFHNPDSRIEFFRQELGDGSFPMFGNARHVSRDLPKDAVVALLMSWLQGCEEYHTRCKSTPAKLPGRILDVSGETPRLVQFPDGGFPTAPYVTLSHCWGDPSKSRPTMTTKRTLESRKDGIPASDLSPLFRDAVELCKGIGCDYLWIDSLCIIQDDDSDWETESRKMAEIYSNAYFNIAAARSANSANGLFEERWTFGENNSFDRHPIQEYPVGVHQTSGCPIYARISHDKDHRYIQGDDDTAGRWAQAPLLTRAWVLQEVLLARRVLYVCASELIWECEELYDCECKSIHSTPLSYRAGWSNKVTLADGSLIGRTSHRKRELGQIRDGPGLFSMKSIRDLWLELSVIYSCLSITKRSDRPIALAGLVDAVRATSNGTWCYGIWIEDMPRALLWRGYPGSASRLSEMPTWSWMSRLTMSNNCRMEYDLVFRAGFKEEPRTSLFALPDQEDSNHGERERPQSITFLGPALLGRKVELRETPVYGDDEEPDIGCLVHLGRDSTLEPSLSEGTFFYADCLMSPEDRLRDGDTVACLLFGTDEECFRQYALVVKVCPGMEEGGIPYCRRVGICYPFLVGLDGEDIDYFEDAEIMTMRII